MGARILNFIHFALSKHPCYYTVHLLNYLVCEDADINLAHDTYVTSYGGIVQVCINNTLGYVCDENWTVADATVVCRQLGYSTIGNKAMALANYTNLTVLFFELY